LPLVLFVLVLETEGLLLEVLFEGALGFLLLVWLPALGLLS